MKRYLNKVKTINVQKQAGKNHKYIISDAYVPENNEILIGRFNNTVVGLFICKVEGPNRNLYSISFDDFSYDFLNFENNRINNAFTVFNQNISSISSVPVIDLDLPGGE